MGSDPCYGSRYIMMGSDPVAEPEGSETGWGRASRELMMSREGARPVGAELLANS